MSRPSAGVRRPRMNASQLQNYIVLALISATLIMGFCAFYVPPARNRMEDPKKDAPALIHAAESRRAMREEISAADFGRIAGIILGMLDKELPFTFFAPSDEALENLTSVFKPSNKDMENLRNICTHLLHFAVVPHAIPLSVMGKGRLLRVESLSGMTINIARGPGKTYFVNGHSLLTADKYWGNIVIHEIDYVLMPMEFQVRMQWFGPETEGDDDEPVDLNEKGEDGEQQGEAEDEAEMPLADIARNMSKLVQARRSGDVTEYEDEDSDTRNREKILREGEMLLPEGEKKKSEEGKKSEGHGQGERDDGGREENKEPKKKVHGGQSKNEGSQEVEGAENVEGGGRERDADRVEAGETRSASNLQEDASGLAPEEKEGESGEDETCHGHGIPSRGPSGVTCDCVVAYAGTNCERGRDMQDYLVEPYTGPGRHLILTRGRVARALDLIAQRKLKRRKRRHANKKLPARRDLREAENAPPGEVESGNAKDNGKDNVKDEDGDVKGKEGGGSEEDDRRSDPDKLTAEAWLGRLEPLRDTLKELSPEMPAELLSVLPAVDSVKEMVHRRCAVVGSSGALLLSRLGNDIDSHDFVIRFNAAPTRGYEDSVGSKTSLRVTTHEWLGFKEGNETSILHLWLRNPTEELTKAVRYKREFRKGPLLVFDPMFSHHVFLTLGTIPSTGFMGIAFAMHICHEVRLYGFMAGDRQVVKYHYYDHEASPRPAAELDREMEVITEVTDAGLITLGEPCHVECEMGMGECATCLHVTGEELERRSEWTAAQAKENDKREQRWLLFMRWEEREREHTLRDLSQSRRPPPANTSQTQELGNYGARGNVWTSLIEEDNLGQLPLMTLLMYFRQHHITVPASRHDMIQTIKAHHHFYLRNLEQQTTGTYYPGE